MMKQVLGALILAVGMSLGSAFPTQPQTITSTPKYPVQVIGESHLPLILSSSGSMGNNGALTLTTALPNTYSAAYFYMEAGQVAAGSAAGWYYGVMSDTSHATLYNNVYVSGTTTIPASPVSLVTTGPGAFTRTVSAYFSSFSFNIAASQVGAQDTLRIQYRLSAANNANSKNLQIKIGNTNIRTPSNSSVGSLQETVVLSSRGAQNVQVAGPFNGTPGGSSSASSVFAIDFTQQQAFSITQQLSVATDYFVFEDVVVELLRGV